MEHLGSSGPLPTEPGDLPQGQGWARPPAQGRVEGQRLCPPTLLSQAPGPQIVACTLAFIELASHQCGTAAAEAPIFWNHVLSNALL